MVVIGISGKKGSGKDTIADILVKEHNFYKFSFADHVKEVCKVLFNFSHDQMYNHTLKDIIDEKIGISPREAMQKIGTEFGQCDIHKYFPNLRCDHKTFWLDSFDKIYNRGLDKPQNIVISDVRFPHEISYLRKYGCIFWNVQRNIQEDSKNDDYLLQHVSENSLSDVDIKFDLIIDNNSDITVLQEYILNIVS